MIETKTVKLPVTLPKGFDECGRCVNRLKDALKQIDGVSDVKVDPPSSTMTITYDPHLTPLEDVEKRAANIGVDLQEHFEHKTLKLTGLDCPDCALKLEKGVGKMDGVLWVSTNFASSRMSIEYEPEKTGVGAITRRVNDLGYGIKEPETTQAGIESERESKTGGWHMDRHSMLTGIAGLAIVIALIFSALGISVIAKLFYGTAAVIAGYQAARGAVYSIRSLVLDMNFLMTVAAIGAIVIGEWFDAAMVMFLFSLGNALEVRTVERTRESVRSLLNLFPSQARVRRDGADVMIPINEVQVGDQFIVLPGEKIPTDGIILSGASTVNQASVTGESVPVEKEPGDTIFAGTINQRGSIDARATTTVEDNTLAKIVHLVEKAQAEKAPAQRFTEIFGRYYTPVVVIAAVLISTIPPFVFGQPFIEWFYKSLTLLVVSCPCALVISTPVSIVSAIGNAAHNGVLIKGGTHLESIGNIKVVAFDKTGTITTGESMVTDIIPSEGFSEDKVLSLAASVESRSEHPLAAAILRKAEEMEIKPDAITDFEALTGMGAAAKFDGVTCLVGNSRLMEQLSIDLSKYQDILTSLQEQGKTAVLVATQGSLAGIIAISDTLRSTVKEAFSEFRRIGIERIVMITGDNEKTARAVARDLDIDEYYAELLPQDKVDIVRLLIERFGSSVAVVGDGVNDAPALAAATVGVAMGVAGSDTALETADIALMSEDLRKLPFAVRLGRRALSTIRQNIGFSLAVIVLLITTAMIGWLTLSLGVFGHEGSALIVIANGMRLLRFR